jgi:hypothetical protein
LGFVSLHGLPVLNRVPEPFSDLSAALIGDIVSVRAENKPWGWQMAWRQGMKMYQAVWERDGERVATYALPAADEADALSTAEAFFAEHPEFNFPRDGVTARARVITFPLNNDDDY